MLYRTQGKTFALVIPTLNEAGNIDRVLTRATQVLAITDYDYEIVVVDDGSSDGTTGKVQEWSARDPRVRLLCRVNERGLAGAVLYGWSQTDAKLLGVMDADLQHPPELLPEILRKAQSADIVIASRYAEGNGTAGWNPLRVAISRASTFAAACFLSKRVRATDPMSGFFAVRRSCIEGLSFQTSGFKLLLEILVRGRIKNLREVPYHFGTREAGKSKASAAVGFQYLHLLSRLSRDLVWRSSAT